MLLVWCAAAGAAGAGRAGKRLLQSQLQSLFSPSVQWSRYLKRFSGGLPLRGHSTAIGWRKRLLMYLAVPGGLATYHALRPSYVAAYCKQKYPGGIQRLTPPTHLHLHDNQHPFNWSLFAKFILPDLILLLVAVGVSLFPYSLHQFGLTSHPYPPECSGGCPSQYFHSLGTGSAN